MIKNSKIVQKFEEELIKKEKVNLIKNFQIMDAMYKEARALRVIPMKDSLNGWEIDAKIAQAVNYVSKTSQKNISKNIVRETKKKQFFFLTFIFV